jgi:hypothetical protein
MNRKVRGQIQAPSISAVCLGLQKMMKKLSEYGWCPVWESNRALALHWEHSCTVGPTCTATHCFSVCFARLWGSDRNDLSVETKLYLIRSDVYDTWHIFTDSVTVLRRIHERSTLILLREEDAKHNITLDWSARVWTENDITAGIARNWNYNLIYIQTVELSL